MSDEIEEELPEPPFPIAYYIEEKNIESPPSDGYWACLDAIIEVRNGTVVSIDKRTDYLEKVTGAKELSLKKEDEGE